MMKKVFTLLVLCVLSSLVQAQQFVSQQEKDFSEFFNGAEVRDPLNPSFGMFWHHEDKYLSTGLFSAHVKRSSDTTGMLVAVTQPMGQFASFGFDFGKSNTGSKNVLDLSEEDSIGDIFMGAGFTNYSNYYLKIRISLIDSNGLEKNTYNESTDGVNTIYDPTEDAIYAGDFELILEPGSSVQFDDVFEGSSYIQFARSYSKYWSLTDSSVYCRPCHDIDNGVWADSNYFKVPGFENGFNWKAVSGVRFTVVNREDIGAFYDYEIQGDSGDMFNYGPEPIENALIGINYLYLSSDGFDGTPSVSLQIANNENALVDFDNDGVLYRRDVCPNTEDGEEVDQFGCSVNQLAGLGDRDRDGVIDNDDACSYTIRGAIVDEFGCSIDDDADGVLNENDICAFTLKGVAVEANGCPIDFDNDGVLNADDLCANTPSVLDVDVNGCPIDNDQDGVLNTLDECPFSSLRSVVDNVGCELDADNDGIVDSRDFCVNTPSGVDVDRLGCEIAVFNPSVYLPGCTDPLATNYNPYTICPGICEYAPVKAPLEIVGCSDRTATNYNPLANVKGVCEYNVFYLGCLDKSAINYNDEALVDDGSCEYGLQGDVTGCTDRYAYNFNGDATVDNGSCEYYQEYLDTAQFVFGCRDRLALNYSLNATFDNSSCIYSQDTVNQEISLGDEIIEIEDTLIDNINFCEFNFDLLIDSVVIESVKQLEDSTELEWGIYQRGGSIEITNRYAKAAKEDDLSLLYLTIECGGEQNRTAGATKSRTFRTVLKTGEVTAVKEVVSTKSFTIYPNPFSSDLSLRLDYSGTAIVSIINTSGFVVRVRNVAFVNGQADISLEELPTGFYLVEVQKADGEILRQQVIKR